MEYTTNISEENGIIITRLSGALTTESLSPITLETRLMAKEKRLKVLLDFRNTEGQIPKNEAFYWFDNHYDKMDITLKEIKTAHLTLEKSKDYKFFVERTFQIKGGDVKLFTDEEEAIKWLVSDEQIKTKT